MKLEMAILTDTPTGSSATAKAHVRYIQHRRGKDDQRITRTLFGFDGAMTRKQAYEMIDEAKEGSWFYRFVLSPDPKREDTQKDLNLWEITVQIAPSPALYCYKLYEDYIEANRASIVLVS